VSLLDPEQVRKTLAHLQEAADRRHQVDPGLPLELLVQRAQVERLFAGTEGAAAGARSWRRGGVVEAGLDALFTWISGIR
jgi:hypothetical protein